MTSDEYQKLLDLILEIKDITIENTVVLKEHERRSTASENRVDIQEKKLEETIKHFDSRFDPIEDHIKFVGWLIKGAGALIALLGTIVGILQGLGKL